MYRIPFLLTLILLLAQPCEAQSKVEDQLLELMRQSREYWPEGSMTCEVQSVVEGLARVEANWIANFGRYEYESIDDSGVLSMPERWVVSDGKRVMSYLPSHFSANIKPLSMTQTAPSLRVAPHDAWLEIHSGISFIDWRLKPKRDYLWSAERVGSGFRLIGDRDGGYSGGGTTFVAEFNSFGLPTKYYSRIKNPKFVQTFQDIEWEQRGGGPPVPVHLLRRIRRPDSGEFSTLLQIRVIRFNTRCQLPASRMRTPPSDLPIGTNLHRFGHGGKVDSEITGGEEGRIQFRLNKAIRSLRPDPARLNRKSKDTQ